MERIAILDDDKPSRGSIKAFTPMQLGDYQLVREIGRGGMGIVYEAIQISLHRQVAVKVLPPQFHSDSKHKRRFEREAQAAAKLHHTHIVPVFGVGEHNGVSYYVMQLIPGLSFDVVLKQIWRIKFEQASTVNDANVTVFDSTPWNRSKVAPLTQSFLTGSFDEIDLENSGDQESSDSNSSASQLLGVALARGEFSGRNKRTISVWLIWAFKSTMPWPTRINRGSFIAISSLQLDPRSTWKGLGYRLWSGEVEGPGRFDSDRRPARHDPLHAPRSLGRTS